MPMRSLTAQLARTLLALVFLFSGAVKAIDPLGTVFKIEDYLTAFGGFFTHLVPLATIAAFALITFEWVMGVCMLLNVRTNWTAWLSLCFYCVMTPLTLYIAIKNPVSDCGCFGDALVITNWQTFWKNVVLTLLVVALLLTKSSLYQTWSDWMEGIWVMTSFVAVIAFMTWTLYHLPIVDFRPYKIGNHIPTLMEFPEDAEPDEYAITFIYEKDGVQQSFTLDNYPKGDSTWTFVDQQSVLVKKGYEPPIHDFMLMTMDYDDITDDLMESEVPVTFIVMYDLNKSDHSLWHKVAELYDYTTSHGETCYILTGSSDPEIDGVPEDAFLSCDPVTLKTIVRANPGVFVVQEGTIIDKYNLRNRTIQQ